jgi:MFS family permease
MKLLHPSTCALLAACSGAIGAVHAQEATGAPAAATTDDNMSRVVVTARRREESLQDVPVSVTAFSADQLSKQALPDVTALALSLPNTTLKASRATNSTLTAFIRGVGQADPLAGFESGVGIYVDDIYLARPQAAVADIVGSKARGGTAVATFQMTSDFGAILGSLAVGQIAQYMSYGSAFAFSGAILLAAAVFWIFAPETRPRTNAEHTEARPLGPDAGGDVP